MEEGDREKLSDKITVLQEDTDRLWLPVAVFVWLQRRWLKLLRLGGLPPNFTSPDCVSLGNRPGTVQAAHERPFLSVFSHHVGQKASA